MRIIEKAMQINMNNLYLDWLEVDGTGTNPMIAQCYRSVDGLGNPEMLDDSTVSWCSCYMNYVIQKAGGRGTRSALARSWLNWGNPSDGQRGDIVVLSRNGSTWQGHVGQLVKKNFLFVWVLGGNQSNEVNVMRFLRSSVLGYRTSLD